MNEKPSHWDELAFSLGAEVNSPPPVPVTEPEPAQPPVFEPPQRRVPPREPPKPRPAGKSDWGKLAANLGLTPELAVEPAGEAGAFLDEVPVDDAEVAASFATTDETADERGSDVLEGRVETESRSDRPPRGEP